MKSFFLRFLLAMIFLTLIAVLFFENVSRENIGKFLPKKLNFLLMDTNNTERFLNVSLDFRSRPKYRTKCGVGNYPSLNCQKLFENVTKIRSNKKDEKKIEKKMESPECSLEELVKDCSRLRFEHGYEDKPVSKEEMDFPIAFAIKMHKDSHQVERLLRTIYRPHNFYCIHVDSKATIQTFRLIKNVADCLKNVVVLTKRINVVYASFRLIEVEFDCMKVCMESNVKWKYYINLTGQEFILKTNREIVEILKIFDGINDIETNVFTIKGRHRHVHKLFGDQLISTKVRHSPFKSNITIYKGSAYGMFTRDFVDFVLTDDSVKVIFDWLKYTYSPEECIWATLNRLPFAPGSYKGFFTDYSRNTYPSKYVNWSWAKTKIKCHGIFVRGICIFEEGDLPWLKSRTEVAANKFYNTESSVLPCLEEWINNKTYSLSLDDFNWNYYKNLPQVKYSKSLRPEQKTKQFYKQQKQIWLKTNKILWD